MKLLNASNWGGLAFKKEAKPLEKQTIIPPSPKKPIDICQNKPGEKLLRTLASATDLSILLLLLGLPTTAIPALMGKEANAAPPKEKVTFIQADSYTPLQKMLIGAGTAATIIGIASVYGAFGYYSLVDPYIKLTKKPLPPSDEINWNDNITVLASCPQEAVEGFDPWFPTYFTTALNLLMKEKEVKSLDDAANIAINHGLKGHWGTVQQPTKTDRPIPGWKKDDIAPAPERYVLMVSQDFGSSKANQTAKTSMDILQDSLMDTEVFNVPEDHIIRIEKIHDIKDFVNAFHKLQHMIKKDEPKTKKEIEPNETCTSIVKSAGGALVRFADIEKVKSLLPSFPEKATPSDKASRKKTPEGPEILIYYNAHGNLEDPHGIKEGSSNFNSLGIKKGHFQNLLNSLPKEAKIAFLVSTCNAGALTA